MFKALRKRSADSAAGDQDPAGPPQNRIGSLAIAGFRGIGQLTIANLGDVSLVAGRNGVGKTTILEALRVYAGRGHADVLREILVGREELKTFQDEDGDSFNLPTIDRLFYRKGGTIEVGPITGSPTLKISEVRDPSDVPERVRDYFGRGDVRYLMVTFDDKRFFLPSSNRWQQVLQMTPWSDDMSTTQIRCESVGPTPPGSQRMAGLWDNVVLTDDELLPLDALRLIFGDHVERMTVIGDGGLHTHRRVVVKLTNQATPVPLRSLGEGAVRMFSIALALANCRDGILLIDEVENGIHYALQSKLWNMVLRTARTHNTQVVATTHSKDCIDGFAAAAAHCPDVSANLTRIDRHNGKLYAVEYSKGELETAADQNIEVR